MLSVGDTGAYFVAVFGQDPFKERKEVQRVVEMFYGVRDVKSRRVVFRGCFKAEPRYLRLRHHFAENDLSQRRRDTQPIATQGKSLDNLKGVFVLLQP